MDFGIRRFDRERLSEHSFAVGLPALSAVQVGEVDVRRQEGGLSRDGQLVLGLGTLRVTQGQIEQSEVEVALGPVGALHLGPFVFGEHEVQSGAPLRRQRAPDRRQQARRLDPHAAHGIVEHGRYEWHEGGGYDPLGRRERAKANQRVALHERPAKLGTGDVPPEAAQHVQGRRTREAGLIRVGGQGP
jgi:hypothetical protein